ncbi:MAG: hypothetical protein HY390_02855 [Deltaproteobacteria bacterium]|nr:hypothetical protein [Deltaproteobacteria bacterium]
MNRLQKLCFISLTMVLAEVIQLPLWASSLKTSSDAILPYGQFNLTLQGSYLHEAMGFDQKTPATHLWDAPSLNLLLGLGPLADFELHWDIFHVTQTRQEVYQDVSDVSFFTRFQIFQEGLLPSIAARLGTKLPNASDEDRAGTDLMDIYLWGILGKQMGHFHILSNIGLLLFDRADGGQRDALGYRFAIEYPFSNRWTMTSEFAGQYEKTRSPINQSLLNLEIAYQPLKTWKFFGAVSTGVIQNSENIGVHLGLTRNFHAF